jgi:uncharacterized protein YprB with RNaseH-like and TPR domain
MLRHTFCHLPGVGEATERRLWASGLTSWDDLLAAGRGDADLLRESARRHGGGDPAWFCRMLRANQAWRLFPDFRSDCAYLDIETTGLLGHGHVTTVALYDGQTVRTYVRGVNLDAFAGDVAAYRVLVTYNGRSFDVPFLERDLGCRLPQAHIDLRHVLHALGLKGGLKGCERQLGVRRPVGMEDVDGYVAVLLWHQHRRSGDPRALETLLAYNVQDTVNLETLLALACNRRLAALADVPFAAGYRVHVPEPPPNPFRADAETVARVLRDYPAPRPQPARPFP